MSTIHIPSRLYLGWDNHGLDSNGILPWVLGVSGCNTQVRCCHDARSSRLAGTSNLAYVDVIVDGVYSASPDSGGELAFDLTEDTDS